DIKQTISSLGQVNKISFYLGIDSMTNVSGAMGGDLDPTKGMYWTWQSGYINFKLEGKTSLCPAKNNAFTYHIGGYKQPNYALQKIALPVHVQGHDLKVKLDIKALVNSIDFAQLHHIMSPSAAAVKLAEQLSKHFYIHSLL
ncbi:MAG: MbnP family protein, partial [Saprospiraceae bacterium]